MKKILALVSILLAYGAGLSWAEDKKPADPWKNCRNWYTVKYDKFKDVTLIRPENLRRESLPVQNPGGNIGFYVVASFPGQTYDPKKPVTLSILLTDLELSNLKTIEEAKQSPKLLYRDCSTLVLLADDVKMDFGTLKYDSIVSFDGYAFIDQTMTGPLTLKQLKTLAAATKVEGQLCESTFELRKDEICILNSVLEYLQ